MAEEYDSNPYNLRERKFSKLKSVRKGSEHKKSNREQRQSAKNWYGKYADDLQSSSTDDEKSRPTISNKPKNRKQKLKSSDSTTSQKHATPQSEQIHADPVDVFAGRRDTEQSDNRASGFQSPVHSSAPAEPDVTTAHHEPAAADVTELNHPGRTPADLAHRVDATAHHNTDCTDARSHSSALESDRSAHRHGARPKIYPARLDSTTEDHHQQLKETEGAQASARPPITPLLRPPFFQFYERYTSPNRSSADFFRDQPTRTRNIAEHPTPERRISDSENETEVNQNRDSRLQDSNSQPSEVEGHQGHEGQLQLNSTDTSEGHVSDHRGDVSDHRGAPSDISGDASYHSHAPGDNSHHSFDHASDTSDRTDHSDTDSSLAHEELQDVMANNNRLLAAVATRPELFDGKKPEKAQQWWNSVDR